MKSKRPVDRYKFINTNVPEELFEKVEKYCKETGVKRAKYIRNLISEDLEKRDQHGKKLASL